jgi:hypothetical protein
VEIGRNKVEILVEIKIEIKLKYLEMKLKHGLNEK